MQVMGHHGVGCHAVVVAEAGVIRKTTSGKVQRRACRAAFMAGEFAAVSPPSLPHWTARLHAGMPCSSLLPPAAASRQGSLCGLFTPHDVSRDAPAVGRRSQALH